MAHPISLSEAIEDLRAELLAALAKGAGQKLVFRLRPIELELAMVMTKDAQVDSKVKFWVVELGAEGRYQGVSTHKLKLTLEPRGPDGEDLNISDLLPRDGAESRREK